MLFSSYSWAKFWAQSPWLVEFAERRLGFYVTTVMGFLARLGNFEKRTATPRRSHPSTMSSLVGPNVFLDDWRWDGRLIYCRGGRQLLTTLENESWGKSESPGWHPFRASLWPYKRLDMWRRISSCQRGSGPARSPVGGICSETRHCPGSMPSALETLGHRRANEFWSYVNNKLFFHQTEDELRLYVCVWFSCRWVNGEGALRSHQGSFCLGGVRVCLHPKMLSKFRRLKWHLVGIFAKIPIFVESFFWGCTMGFITIKPPLGITCLIFEYLKQIQVLTNISNGWLKGQLVIRTIVFVQASVLGNFFWRIAKNCIKMNDECPFSGATWNSGLFGGSFKSATG